MNKDRIIYWVSTGILTLIMLFSVFNYLFNHQAITGAFESLGYPIYLIYPVAIAKLLGLAAVLSRVSGLLKNLAYAGFFFNTLLAFFAHVQARDGGFIFALIAFVAVIFSYFYERKAFAS